MMGFWDTIRAFVGWGCVLAVCLIVLVSGLKWAGLDNESIARHEALTQVGPEMLVKTRDGVLSLWSFEFEGRRCIWAVSEAGHSHRSYGGLTCWKEEDK